MELQLHPTGGIVQYPQHTRIVLQPAVAKAEGTQMNLGI